MGPKAFDGRSVDGYPEVMIHLLAVALTLAGPARCETSMADAYASLRSAAPDPAALEAQIRGADRTAAREAAAKAAEMMSGFGSDDQKRLVTALRDVLRGENSFPEVREEALRDLGRSAAWLRDDQTRRDAIGDILGVMEASPSPVDARSTYRVNAVRALQASIGALPAEDRDFERRAATALLNAYAATPDGGERTVELKAIEELIRTRPRVAQRNDDPYHRFASVVFEPVRASATAFASGGTGAGANQRWETYHVLLALAIAIDDDQIHQDIKTFFDDAARVESDSFPLANKTYVQRIVLSWPRLTRVTPS